MKVIIRKSVVILLTIIFYILSFYYLFVNLSWLNAIILLIFLFLILPYFFIEIKGYNKKYFFAVLILLSLFQINLFQKDLYIVFGIILFNLSIFMLYTDVYDNLYNKLKIDSFSIFTGGIAWFSLIISLVFALLIMDKYKSFNLKCEDLYNGIYSLIDNISKPLKVSVKEVNLIKDKINEFYSLKVKDILGIQTISGSVLTGNLNNFILSGYDLNGLNNKIYISDKGIIGKLQEFKLSLVDKVIKDKRSVDKGICEYMIENINKYYSKPGIRLTALILIVLLLQPFLRIGLYIISILNWILFEIFRLFKVYKIDKILVDKDIIL